VTGVAVVTGAASGIGAAICRTLAGVGYAVGSLDADETGAAAVAADLQGAAGGRRVPRARSCLERLLVPSRSPCQVAGPGPWGFRELLLFKYAGQCRGRGRDEQEYGRYGKRPSSGGAKGRRHLSRGVRLAGLGQRCCHFGHGARLRVRAYDGADQGYGLPVLPGPGQRSRDLGQGGASDSGVMMVRANASACWYCPARASACAISATACSFGYP
jgi:hypothetical protein